MRNDFEDTLPAEVKRKRVEEEEGVQIATKKKKKHETETAPRGEKLCGLNIIDLTEDNVSSERNEEWKDYACYRCQGTFETEEELALHVYYKHASCSPSE